MALITLWVTFGDADVDTVARTTRELVADSTAEDLSYLVLHMAGLTRGLMRAMGNQDVPDVADALQAVGLSVQGRASAATPHWRTDCTD